MAGCTIRPFLYRSRSSRTWIKSKSEISLGAVCCRWPWRGSVELSLLPLVLFSYPLAESWHSVSSPLLKLLWVELSDVGSLCLPLCSFSSALLALLFLLLWLLSLLRSLLLHQLSLCFFTSNHRHCTNLMFLAHSFFFLPTQSVSKFLISAPGFVKVSRLPLRATLN